MRAISPPGIENVIREAELEEMESKWREENERIIAPHPPDARSIPIRAPTPPAMRRHAGDAGRSPTSRLPLEAPAAPDDDPTPAGRAAAAMIGDLDESKAPLLDHLIELRRRLLWCVAALLVAFFVCLYFAKPIFARAGPAAARARGRASSSTPTFSKPFSSR